MARAYSDDLRRKLLEAHASGKGTLRALAERFGVSVETILGALNHQGMLAAMTVEAATDREVFLPFLDQVLCPKLRPGDMVVMDNLSAHKVAGVRESIAAAGARLLYLPPHSPDLNPTEKPGPSSKPCSAKPRLAARKPSTKP